ncbi:hypothetical protein CSUB01_10958 [Colletotrichum sublineola]|uniref:Uncharacterized protein n=1 Tax=Colletotrichum sublineola TaxID=1173701 RepID=A0A066XSE0_COLSU|nr:hypothetical protein CSUB01_10958 [Colletotrichum sublineola]
MTEYNAYRAMSTAELSAVTPKYEAIRDELEFRSQVYAKFFDEYILIETHEDIKLSVTEFYQLVKDMRHKNKSQKITHKRPRPRDPNRRIARGSQLNNSMLAQ